MADADPKAAFLKVDVEGSSIELDAVSVEVEDDDRKIDKATVVVDDPHRPYGDFVDVGMTVRIELGWATNHGVVFEGVVAAPAGECLTNGKRVVTITALDPSQRMNRERRLEGHTGALGDILKKLVERTEYQGKIAVGKIVAPADVSFTKQNPLAQHNQTDWQVIHDCAERHRSRAFVEYNDGKSQFYFLPVRDLLKTKTLGSLNYCNGTQIIDFQCRRVAGRAAPQATASVMDPRTGEVVTTPAPAPPVPDPEARPDPETAAQLNRIDPNLAKRHAAAAQVAAGAKEKPAAQRPQVALGGVPSDPTLPAQVGERDQTELLGWQGNGTTVGTIEMRAKGKVAISGIAAWAEGDWYIRRVNHVYTRVLDEERRNRSTYFTKFYVTR